MKVRYKAATCTFEIRLRDSRLDPRKTENTLSVTEWLFFSYMWCSEACIGAFAGGERLLIFHLFICVVHSYFFFFFPSVISLSLYWLPNKWFLNIHSLIHTSMTLVLLKQIICYRYFDILRYFAKIHIWRLIIGSNFP